MDQRRSGLWQVHSAVLLFALSGLFAKWLTLPAYVIVFGRAVIAALVMMSVLSVLRKSWQLTHWRQHQKMAVSAVVLSLHWVTFFASIQYANVTVGLLTFASFPLFVSVLEPWFFKEPFTRTSIFQALVILIGMYLVAPLHTITEQQLIGVALGLLSAFTFAILALLNRQLRTQHSGSVIALWQNAYASLTLLPLMYFFQPDISPENAWGLIILGVIFTGLAHALFVQSLSAIKAHTASIVVSLEPIYGIVAAVILFNEPLTLMIVSGALLIIGVNVWAMQHKSTDT